MQRIILCFIVLCCVQFSFGQSSENVIKLLVDKQMISQEEADTLIEKSREESKTKNVVQKVKSAFNSSDYFKLSGYGQAYYQLSDNTEINNSMRINRIILFAEGTLIPKLTYMLMYDFGPKPGLHEYYLEYAFVPELSLRFGQYKVPFTLESPISPTRWESIFGSLVINALAGISADVIGAKAGRDMGVQLSGKLFRKNNFHQVEYAAGLFNGTGMNTPENNNHKDFAGTLIYRPVESLKLAGTVYSGKALYVMPGSAEARNHVRDRWSVGGEFSNKSWYARSEYVSGNDGGIDRDGYYAVGMWKPLPSKLEIFGKYDYYNPDKDGRLSEVYEYTGGVNYYFAPLSRVQLNYIHTSTDSDANNMLAVQVQLFF